MKAKEDSIIESVDSFLPMERGILLLRWLWDALDASIELPIDGATEGQQKEGCRMEVKPCLSCRPSRVAGLTRWPVFGSN